MRKNIKKVIFSSLVALMVISSSLTVSAATSQTGTLAGKKVSGAVSINEGGASASTSISVTPGSGSSATVSLLYTYTNIKTKKNTTVNAGGNGNIAVSASRSNPNKKDYRSWRAKGTHKVTYSGQTWNANTEIYY